MDVDRKPFETWAIVEIMGHQRFAGRVTEEAIAGQNQLRVDIPQTSIWPEHTKYFGGSSIYALHPCTEEIARAAAERLAQQYGYTPLPVAVPDVSKAVHIIRQAEAARAETPALAPGSGREPWEDDDEDDEDEEF